MTEITNKNFLIKGNCYKKASDNTHLGKYTGWGSDQETQGKGDHAFFKKPDGYYEYIQTKTNGDLTSNVIEIPCPVVATSAALGAGAGPMMQQQWLNYTQLKPGSCYIDQNMNYVGKYFGSNNAYFDAQQYTIVHRFDKFMLAGMNWSFWETSCQSGGKGKTKKSKKIRKH